MEPNLNWRKIRQIRKAKGLTIKELSDLSGVSSSLISQIERGIVDPTVTNFWKLCKGLDMPINTFFEEEKPRIVIRANERKTINFRVSDPGVKYHLLSPNDDNVMVFLLIEIEPGVKKDDKDFITHRGEECGYVLSGELAVFLDDKEYILREGDSIYFKSTIPHRFENRGESISRSIWTMTPPTDDIK